MSHYYIGLISGTSMDAVDAAIVDFSSPHQPRLVGYHAESIPDLLKQKTRALCVPGDNEINRLGEVDVEWGRLFALSVQKLLQKSGLSSKDIIAIGSHGQTIRHSPKSSHPFTLQIGDPNTIAALTGITTVADVRRMDIACGGHGAPLGPAFHRYLLQETQHDTMFVNIGGIANVTYLPFNKTKNVIGFDTGPGNTLMDAWCRRHLNQHFDENGKWAMQGDIDYELLNRLLEDAYFSHPFPKSTGPEYFHLDWVNSTASPVDTQRTLLELTAQTITNAIMPLTSSDFCEVLLCGGGARNNALLQRIQALLGEKFSVLTTDHYGAPGDWVEAMLLAWLAKMRLEKTPLDLRDITGSGKPVLLGGVFCSVNK